AWCFRIFFYLPPNRSFTEASSNQCVVIAAYVVRHPMYFRALSGLVQQLRMLLEKQSGNTFHRNI
ncbi:hypothetical protein QMO17_32740, partial [Klebsiella pneumoniae]|nr:hypothetical protein [Klebsiella pneumoniae]